MSLISYWYTPLPPSQLIDAASEHHTSVLQTRAVWLDDDGGGHPLRLPACRLRLQVVGAMWDNRGLDGLW